LLVIAKTKYLIGIFKAGSKIITTRAKKAFNTKLRYAYLNPPCGVCRGKTSFKCKMPRRL